MKIILSYIIFLISVISVHGQVFLRVTPDKRDLQTDEQLKLTIVLEIQGNDFDIQSPIHLPDFTKFNIIGSGSENNTDLNIRTKTIVYQVLLQPKQTGKIKIGSVLYIGNDKIYKTEPFDVFVTEATKKEVAKADTDNEMYLKMEVKNKSVYENQPTVAILKAYSKNFDNFRKVSNIKFPKSREVNFHPINFKKSDIEQDSDSKMSSQVIGIFLISTSENGEINIPAVSASVKNNTKSATIKSNKIFLKVKKLPKNAPESFKNAIGNFKIHLDSNTQSNNTVGQPVDVNLTISGDGNFHNMQLPQLAESADYTFFPPKIIYNTQSSENGSTGNVVLKYILIPKKSGEITLKTNDFSYFETSSVSYKSIPSDTIHISAMTPEEISDAKSTLQKVNDYTSNVLDNVNAPKIISSQLKIPSIYKINYKIIIGNLVLLCGLVFFIFTYRAKKEKKLKNKKIKKQKIENIHETEERLKSEKPLDFQTELDYLEKLKNNEDFTGFFTGYETFQKELEKFSQNNFGLNFNNYLLQNKGAKIEEDFRNLNQEISIEKFTPFHSEESINNLFQKLKILISEIK
jgi:hypothetical protein